LVSTAMACLQLHAEFLLARKNWQVKISANNDLALAA